MPPFNVKKKIAGGNNFDFFYTPKSQTILKQMPIHYIRFNPCAHREVSFIKGIHTQTFTYTHVYQYKYKYKYKYQYVPQRAVAEVSRIGN